MPNQSAIPHFFLLICLIANITTFPHVMAQSGASNSSHRESINDEQAFIFAGRCPNGEGYRIFAYPMDVDGLSQSFYDFDGPAGKGTVRTNSSPKKLAVRVCHTSADIQDGSKFD